MAHHPVDIYVGKKLREIRIMRGLSQEELGSACGVTFQQIQKYERAQNRISASRMYEFGKVLNTSPTTFFEHIEDSISGTPGDFSANESEGAYQHEPQKSKEILTLIRAYSQIGDQVVRQRIYSLVKAIAGDKNEDDSAV